MKVASLAQVVEAMKYAPNPSRNACKSYMVRERARNLYRLLALPFERIFRRGNSPRTRYSEAIIIGT